MFYLKAFSTTVIDFVNLKKNYFLTFFRMKGGDSTSYLYLSPFYRLCVVFTLAQHSHYTVHTYLSIIWLCRQISVGFGA